ncbi:MAG: MXAN_6640 family putative metalloprotease [Bacteroidota bacterium]
MRGTQVEQPQSEGFTRVRVTAKRYPRCLLRQLGVLSISVIIQFPAVSNITSSFSGGEMFDERSHSDSLFLHIKRLLSPVAGSSALQTEKCGFRYQFEVRRYWTLLSPDKQVVLKALFTRPTLQASVLSPSGHFRVHYDTTGGNSPALVGENGDRLPGTAKAYVNSVGAVFDYVWDFETRALGYPSPPGDKGADGGNEYDIYILELSGSLYGQTLFNEEDLLDPRRPNPTYASFIEIDNDYVGYFSRGLQGLRVTAAHELHHAIQIGDYGFWRDDVYYYELTSTWIEDVVYPAVNDYYQYLPVYFSNTSIPFNISNGYAEYGRALWGKFIEKRFGREVMRRSWEYMNASRSLPAIDASLRERGTSFVRELPEFSLWHFYTGSRADTTHYFPEGRAYAEVRARVYAPFVPPNATISHTARNLSIQFYQLAMGEGPERSDTISMALTNINLAAAEKLDDRQYDFSYRFTTEAVNESYETLKNGLKVKLIVPDPMNWKSIALLNTAVNIEVETSPYPNPFIAGKSSSVAFPIDARYRTLVTLNIYSSSFDLVYSKAVDSSTQFGKQVVFWDGKDANGNPVSSGIYVYRIVSPEKEYKGKIAVVRQ